MSPVPTKKPKEYVVGFLFGADSYRVALVEKKRPAWQAGRLNGIGGKIEPHEEPLAAMTREFEEETGAHLTGWRQFLVLSGTDWRVYFFTRQYEPGDMKPLQTTTDEKIGWYKVDDVLRSAKPLPNLRWLLPLALDDDRPCGWLTNAKENP